MDRDISVSSDKLLQPICTDGLRPAKQTPDPSIGLVPVLAAFSSKCPVMVIKSIGRIEALL